MKYILLLMVLLCAGCASPNTIEYTSDSNGRWIRTVYSKGYISPQTEVGAGIQVVITGVDEGKVNPVAAAIGALGPETETPPASYVLHFRNITSESVNLELGTLKVRDVEYPVEPKTATLGPGEILDSNKIMASVSLWSHEIPTEVKLKVGTQEFTTQVVLKQETMEEYKARMKRYKESKKK